MADAEDYDFEGGEAGASDAVPIEAGQIRKGGYMVIKGRPCKVSEVSHSKTGKHGSAKCNFSTYVFGAVGGVVCVGAASALRPATWPAAAR